MSLPVGAITLSPPLAIALNKSSKDATGSVRNTVQGTKQPCLGSTWTAMPFFKVPHYYQHKVNEMNHVQKIITIIKKWSEVPQLHPGRNGNQAIKFHRPNLDASPSFSKSLTAYTEFFGKFFNCMRVPRT